jgi:hypothetical protein
MGQGREATGEGRGVRGEGQGSHAPHLILLAGAAILWTWPLAIHFRHHIPGTPGDNFSFLWNLWWMRHVLAAPAGGYFHSSYLFFPFGVDLVNHPNTALQGLVSATLLAKLSIIEAENLYIIVSVFLNGVAAYALAYDIGRRRRLALLAGVAYGGSPYIAAHLFGHFDLLTAWVIPLFALLFRRALLNGSWKPAVGAGLCVAVAAYSAYYYVVYLALFAVTYALGWLGEGARGEGQGASVPRDTRDSCPSPRTPHPYRAGVVAFTIRLLALGALALDLFLMIWIWISGGATLRLAGADVSLRGFQNPLLAMWVLAIVWALARWNVRPDVRRPSAEHLWRAIQALTITAAVFAVVALPLIVQAFRLAVSGRYVSQVYFWRSAPRGIDLSSLVTGNPFHPVFGSMVSWLYSSFGLNRVEQVAWLGVVPIGVLLFARGKWLDPAEARRWKIVLAVFLVWALGPFLTIAGLNLGLPLPETLARFIPLVENARVPGRAMVGVYLALGVLMVLRLAAAPRPFKREPGSLFEWTLIGLLALDYLNAPMPLTALDRPAIYEELAAVQDESPVIELPFGIGDGLSTGIGSQERRILYYATIHGHPLVGGYIGRMPPGAAAAYASMPIVGNLLRLSSGQPATEGEPTAAVPFRYVVLDTATASPDLTAYLHQALDMDLIGSSEGRELYAVQGVKPPSVRASR